MKHACLLITLIATIFGAIILFVLGKSILIVLGVGLLILFLIYSLMKPPKKHKEFSLSDQEKAVRDYYGGAGPPEE